MRVDPSTSETELTKMSEILRMCSSRIEQACPQGVIDLEVLEALSLKDI